MLEPQYDARKLLKTSNFCTQCPLTLLRISETVRHGLRATRTAVKGPLSLPNLRATARGQGSHVGASMLHQFGPENAENGVNSRFKALFSYI